MKKLIMLLVVSLVIVLSACEKKPLYYTCYMNEIEIIGVEEYSLESDVVTLVMLDGKTVSFTLENYVFRCEEVFD